MSDRCLGVCGSADAENCPTPDVCRVVEVYKAFIVSMVREKLLHGSNPSLISEAKKLNLPEVSEILSAAVVDGFSPLKQAKQEIEQLKSELKTAYMRIDILEDTCRLKQLIKERDEALMANVCDACLGKPLPAGGLCMCGGTGLLSDAARFLRERVVKLTRERDEAREEVETWVKTYETTHADVLRLAKERDEYRALYEAVSGTSKRDIAERQREADANAVFSEFNVHDYAERAAKAVRATPLVTDGGGE